MKWLGIDIGGANIKLADDDRFAAAVAFPLWREPQRLASELRRLLDEAPALPLAVTMTGELADCFETKSAGVHFILDAVEAAAADRPTLIYLIGGGLVTVDAARREPLAAAASNWHVLASFAGRYVPLGSALLLDVGSTTCDIVPLLDGRVVAAGSDDTQRLACGELLYTGVERSPVCAVVSSVPYRGAAHPVAQELFATMRDVYLTLDELPEDASCCETADGRPATRGAACARLARMLCADRTTFSDQDAAVLAAHVAAAQADRLAGCVCDVAARLPSTPRAVVASGHGGFLIARALAAAGLAMETIWLATLLGPAVARVAASHALAVLAGEKVPP